MRTTAGSLIRAVVPLSLVAGVCSTPLTAQRTFNVGVALGQFTPRGGGDHHMGQSLSLGWLATSTSETDAFITRWGDADFGTGTAGITAYGVDSRYYPVEAAGIAPYFTSGVGLFKYRDPGGLLTPPSDQWGFVSTMGLGLGANLGRHFWLGGEGRLRVDNGSPSSEYRLLGSYGFGKMREMHSRPGTIEPFVTGIARLGHGPYQAGTPYAGVRFRRDESRHSSIAVDVGAAGLDHDGTGQGRVTTWMMQPSGEYGWERAWGRPFLELGPQLIGFVGGIDDGMKVGLHTGGGADIRLGASAELALLTRVTWFQSSDGRHQFGLQLGAAIGPRLMRDRSALPEKAPKVE